MGNWAGEASRGCVEAAGNRTTDVACLPGSLVTELGLFSSRNFFTRRYRFVTSQIKDKVHLVSMSGGSDICSCFLTGDPTSPVREGLLQAEGLGELAVTANQIKHDGAPIKNIQEFRCLLVLLFFQAIPSFLPCCFHQP